MTYQTTQWSTLLTSAAFLLSLLFVLIFVRVPGQVCLPASGKPFQEVSVFAQRPDVKGVPRTLDFLLTALFIEIK